MNWAQPSIRPLTATEKLQSRHTSAFTGYSLVCPSADVQLCSKTVVRRGNSALAALSSTAQLPQPLAASWLPLWNGTRKRALSPLMSRGKGCPLGPAQFGQALSPGQGPPFCSLAHIVPPPKEPFPHPQRVPVCVECGWRKHALLSLPQSLSDLSLSPGPVGSWFPNSSQR